MIWFALWRGVVSSFLILGTGCFLVAGAGSRALAQSTAVDGFNPVVDGAIHALAIQANGKILLGGEFLNVNGEPHRHLARLNVDGTLDRTFSADADRIVSCLLVQEDGRIIVGAFSTWFTNETARYLWRLGPNGFLDTSFTADASGGVSTLAEQADAKVLVGGLYRLARLGQGGVADSFSLSLHSPVDALTLFPDGHILVGTDDGNVTRLDSAGVSNNCFSVGTDGAASSLVATPDGQLLAGGTFARHIARFSTNGILDPNFTANFNDGIGTNQVSSISLQADGKMFVGGSFTSVNAKARVSLAQLTKAGATVAEFDAETDGMVNALAIQKDGQIIVGGLFSEIAGVPRMNIARLKNRAMATETLSYSGNTILWHRTGGSPEITRAQFAYTTDGVSWSDLPAATRTGNDWQLNGISLPANASLRARGFVTGGERNGSGWLIESGNGTLAISSQPCSRTNSYGSIAGFDVLAIGSDSTKFQWYHAGTNLEDNAHVSGARSSSLVLNAVTAEDRGGYFVVITNGSISLTGVVATLGVIDPRLVTPPSAATVDVGQSNTFTVMAVGSEPLKYQWRHDGVAVPAGTFASLTLTNIQPTNRGGYDVVVTSPLGAVTSSVAQLQVIQTPADPVSILGNGTRALCIQPDGKILFTGAWSTFGSSINRCYEDGRLDTNIQVSLMGPNGVVVSSLILQPDNKILVQGTFSSCNGVPRTNLARVNLDGSLDMQFDPRVETSPGYVAPDIECVTLTKDGKILIGGFFLKAGGVARNGLARLNSDGTVDTSFSPNTGSGYTKVTAMAIQLDGKIIIAYTTMDANGWQQNNIVSRLNPDGTLDLQLSVNISGVEQIAVQPDGKILLAVGSSSTGWPKSYLTRLAANGTVDATFKPTFDAPVHAIALQADGKIIVGGEFGYVTDHWRSLLARLNTDGTFDSTFDPLIAAAYTPFNPLNAIAIEPNGKILVGSDSDNYGPFDMPPFWRFRNMVAPTERLQCSGSVVTWLRSGPGPEFNRVEFHRINPDGSFTKLCDGVPTQDGWQSANVVVPNNARIRARGFVSGGYHGSSSWFVDSTCGPVSFLEQPVGLTNALGSSMSLSVQVGGDGPLMFQWLKNGVALTDGDGVAGVTTSTLILSNVLGSDRGGYSVIASNRWGASTSLVMQVGVLDPYVAIQPQAWPSMLVEPVYFRALASGTGELGYQWRKEGVPLVGATSNVFVLNCMQMADRGNYDVVVTNSIGAYTSAPVQLQLMASYDRFGTSLSVTSYCLAIQPDGKVLLGDRCLNADSSLDSSYNLGLTLASNAVSCVALQMDGKILLGGNFTSISPAANRIVRVDSTGAMDATFTSDADAEVKTMFSEPDGSVVIGGNFTEVGGKVCKNIARLHSDGSPNPNFLGSAMGGVNTIAKQLDGKFLVGGAFTNLCGAPWTNFGRLNVDGSLDRAFATSVDGVVNCIVVQPDGKILLAGNFAAVCGVPRSGLSRLNPDGTVDLSFVPSYSMLAHSLALQCDGKLLVARQSGSSWSYGSTFTRLNPDGTLDPLFARYGSFYGYGLGIQEDGNIVTLTPDVHGVRRVLNTDPAYESIQYNGSNVSWLRGGTGPEIWLATFESSTNGTDWIPLGVGQPIAGGWQLTNVELAATARIRARGFVSGGYNNGSSWFVESVYGMPTVTMSSQNRSIPAGGSALFKVDVTGSPLTAIQWFRGDTALEDKAFISGAHTASLSISNALGVDAGNYYAVVSNRFGAVTSVLATLTVADPAIVWGPYFTILNPGQSNSLQTRWFGTDPLSVRWFKDNVAIDRATNGILAFANPIWEDAGAYYAIVSNQFGSATSSVAQVFVNHTSAEPWHHDFSTNKSVVPISFAQQTDGKILMGGAFSSVDNQIRSNLVRFNLDGTVDATFVADADGPVTHLATQEDGRILVAGDFKWLAGRHCPYLTRLNPDGSPDADFDPSINNEINCVLVQPDGKILLGGKFTNLAGRVHGYIGRLWPDGTDDTNFTAYADGPVTQLAVQTDGKIVVGGSFYYLNGTARRYLGRLSADGAMDISFTPQLDSPVANLALQADGGLLVSLGYNLKRLNSDGTLDSAFATPIQAMLTTMAVQVDGKIVFGGDKTGGNAWTIPGRIFSSGAVDGSFVPSTGFEAELLLQADGKVLIGTPGFLSQGSVTRWTNTEPAIDGLTHDESTITWSRDGTAPEIWAAKFAVCTNGTDWLELGLASRIAGGWQLTGLTLPANCAVLARGFVTVSGSSWVIESAVGVPDRNIVMIQTEGSDFGIHSRRFTFWFNGSSHNQVIEGSTNLLDWTALGTNSHANGPLYFSDPALEENSQRFYRIRMGQPGDNPQTDKF